MIKELNYDSPSELEKAYNVLKELRTSLSFEDYRFLLQKAREKDAYRLYHYGAGEWLGLIGMRDLYDFVHGKHLYIDDLVVTEKARGKGIGAKLLQFAETQAQHEACERLRLCTGIENERGALFYLREGWEKRAVAFKKHTPGTVVGPGGHPVTGFV